MFDHTGRPCVGPIRIWHTPVEVETIKFIDYKGLKIHHFKDLRCGNVERWRIVIPENPVKCEAVYLAAFGHKPEEFQSHIITEDIGDEVVKHYIDAIGTAQSWLNYQPKRRFCYNIKWSGISWGGVCYNYGEFRQEILKTLHITAGLYCPWDYDLEHFKADTNWNEDTGRANAARYILGNCEI